MNRESALKWLADFFTAKGAFAAVRELHGMAGSEAPSLFIKKFRALSNKDKHVIAESLKDLALGKEENFREYLPPAAFLLATLCLFGQAKWFLPFRPELEFEFCKEENINIWIESLEGKEVPFKRSWRYALQLSNALYLVGSELADFVRERLIRNAKSDSFKHALTRVAEIKSMSNFPE